MFSAAACLALVVGALALMVVLDPFTGGVDLADWNKRGVKQADPACMRAWNESGPREFLSGYASTAIVERLDGDCLVSTGLNGYVLRGGQWQPVKKAPYSWHNTRHGVDGILTAVDNP